MKQDGKNLQGHGTPLEQPHAGTRPGQPLDGSQYIDVIEEQRYSEQPPTRDAREPHLARQPAEPGAARQPSGRDSRGVAPAK